MDGKNSILDKLNQREAKRLEGLERNLKTKKEANVANREIEDFFTSFKVKTDDIENSFISLEHVNNENISKSISDIHNDIEELQKLLGHFSSFITEYNSRKCQDIVKKLQNRLLDVQDKYTPQPRFGFRSKTAKKYVAKQVENSDTVDGTKEMNKWGDGSIFGFRSRKDEKLQLLNESVFQKDVSMSDLENCTVFVKGSPGTLHLDNLRNCIIISGPVSTSVFVEYCSDCKFVIACQQLRMHSTKASDIYLHVTSKGIIEDCVGIGTAPYNLSYDGIEDDFIKSTLDRSKNNWDNLDDFNWLASDAPSPNWSKIDGDKLVCDWVSVTN